MILRQYFNLGPMTAEEDFAMDPGRVVHKNPKKELDALRASHGGFRLAEKLLTTWLHDTFRCHCTFYYTREMLCYTYYIRNTNIFL